MCIPLEFAVEGFICFIFTYMTQYLGIERSTASHASTFLFHSLVNQLVGNLNVYVYIVKHSAEAVIP